MAKGEGTRVEEGGGGRGEGVGREGGGNEARRCSGRISVRWYGWSFKWKLSCPTSRFLCLLTRQSLPVSSGQPTAIVRHGGRTRELQSVPRRKSPRKQSKSSLRNSRTIESLIETALPVARGVRARRSERLIDSHIPIPRKIERRKTR